MAIIGLSKPIIGDYAESGATTTYSNAAAFDKAVEYAISLTTSEDDNLYADNGIAESDAGAFQSGELTLKTSDIPLTLAKRILSLNQVTHTYGTSKTATEYVHEAEPSTKYIGFGIIEMHRVSGTDKYRAVFLPKISFRDLESAATTKGESIEWQTPEIKATIYRSALVNTNYNHPWKIEADFTTEADAIEYLMDKCGGTENSGGSGSGSGGGVSA